MKKNQKGFGIVEIILVVVIIGLLGVVGWFVYDRHKTPKANTVTRLATTKVTPPPVVKDPTADWIAYSNKEGQFSLKYPKSWVKASHPELCSPGILLLGSNTNSVGKCGSEGFGQVAVLSVEGDKTSDYLLESNIYTGIISQSITLNGVNGKKQTGTYQHAKDQAAGLGDLPDGTSVTIYAFYTNGLTYYARYVSADFAVKYPEALADFNTLVTKTLQFN